MALWLLVVPRKVHWICPDCSSSILYSGAVNTPCAPGRNHRTWAGRRSSQKEIVMLAEPGFSVAELGTST